MACDYSLSEDSLRVIMRGGDVKEPIMQILGSKRIASGSSDKERFRLLLSDGKYVISFAMLTKQIKDKVGGSGDLQDNSIVKIKNYITSVINNSGKGDKRVLVILELETLVSGDKCSKIGNPEQLPEDNADDNKSTSTVNFGSNGPSYKSASGTSSSMKIGNGDNSNVFLQDQLTHPISSLSPYQNKWVIKVRVANKSQIREWSNSRGEGKLFSLDLMDESGEIRVTAFRDLVDKFYDLIEIDKVYYISKCQLKVANKQFNTLKNDYEMTFTNDTIVQECQDSLSDLPQTRFDFISIDKIAHIEVGTLIDLIGICKTSSELQTFQARSTGRELKKREVTLVDQSKNAIVLTLWGMDAEKFDGSSQPVIAIKGAKVGEFGGGKNVSVIISSVLKMNPDLLESHRLRGWYDNEGKQENIVNISAKSGVGGFQTPWMSFKDVQNQGIGTGDKGDYFQAKTTVLLFRSEGSIYKACPVEDCKKKVIDMQNGMYRCEKCNREYPNFVYRLLGSVNVGDWSGNMWISMFASEAEKLLGCSSQAVGEAMESDSEALATFADKAHFMEFIMKLRSKMENYNDESRLKTVAVKVDPVNYKEYNSYLISRIQELIN